MNRSIIALCLTAAVGANLSAQTHPGTLTGITKVSLNAASASTTREGNVIMQGVRIASDTTDPDDYINLTYAMDMSTLALTLSGIAVYPDVGVVYMPEVLFLRDVSPDFTLIRNGQIYHSGTSYPITANADEPFHAMLEAGMSLTLSLRDPSRNYRYIVRKADDGAILRDSYYLKGSRWTAWKTPILASGEYLIYFQPEDASSMTLTMTASNDNRSGLTDLRDQDSFSASFAQQTGNYAKWRIALTRGQTLTVTKMYSSGYDVWSWLIFEDSTDCCNCGFATFAYTAKQTGYYYLVCQMTSAVDGSCAGTISISPSKTSDPTPGNTGLPAPDGAGSGLDGDTCELSIPVSPAPLLGLQTLSVQASTPGDDEP